jgi:MFS family permease
LSETPEAPEPVAPRRVFGFHPNVIALGFTSLFTDISSEMLVPVMPLFVTATLGASIASLGLIEGLAEATASILRLVSGRIADEPSRRKPLVVAGYTLSGVSKTVMALASSWPWLLGLRFGDRVGKAMRTPPRDALLADASDPGALGRTFGLHRAMDTLGAAIGPLVAWWLLTHWAERGSAAYRHIFFVSAIPAAIAVLVLLVFVRPSPPRPKPVAGTPAPGPLGRFFARFVTADVLFQLGNSSNAFLLLRASRVGFDAGGVALVYLLFNLVAALLAMPLGGLADRIGRRPLLLAGYLVYALAYAIAAFAPSQLGVVAAFVLLAVHAALVEGQAKSLVADLVPRERRASAYGIYHAAVGCALLPASIVAGLLWERVGPAAPFAFGAACAVAAAIAFAMLLPNDRETKERHA